MYERVKDVDHPDELMLSVSRDLGIVPRQADDRAESRSIYQLVHPGWLVTNRMQAWRGAVGISNYRGIVSGHYLCFRPRHEENSGYLNLLFRSAPLVDAYAMLSRGVRPGQPEIDNDRYRALPVLVPPIDEQAAIVKYLEAEIAAMDALVAKQRELIETLEARWISELTAALEAPRGPLVPLRRIADVTDCAHVTAEVVEDDLRFPIASIRECGGPVVDLTNCSYTTESFFEILRASGRAPRAGDLLFVRNVSVGLVSEVTSALPAFALGQETVLIRPKGGTKTRYLRYALQSARVRHEIHGAMIGSTFRRINVAAIRALPIPVHPAEEQAAIVEYLDARSVAFERLAARAEQLVALLQERRRALITSVVTGQIDVTDKGF